MPPLIAAALVGAATYAGLRLAREVVARLEALGEAQGVAVRPDRAAPAAGVIAKDLGALEPDPETGVYRPVHRA